MIEVVVLLQRNKYSQQRAALPRGLDLLGAKIRRLVVPDKFLTIRFATFPEALLCNSIFAVFEQKLLVLLQKYH